MIDFVESNRSKSSPKSRPKLDSPAAFKQYFKFTSFGQVAQSVEQETENLRVGGSIPSLATFLPL